MRLKKTFIATLLLGSFLSVDAARADDAKPGSLGFSINSGVALCTAFYDIGSPNFVACLQGVYRQNCAILPNFPDLPPECVALGYYTAAQSFNSFGNAFNGPAKP
jgi:hypothetical protein